MTEQEIIEGNKVISKFDGWKFSKYKNDTAKPPKDHFSRLKSSKYFFEMKYHTSWIWLMQIVEKIEAIDENDTDYESEIIGKFCQIGVRDEHSASANTKIEAVWLSVVAFIKWYNSQVK